MFEKNTLVVREMNTADIQLLSEVYYQTRLETFEWLDTKNISIEDFARDTEGERIWVAGLNDHVIGFVSACELENFIHHLYVLPEFSGRNIGTQLLNTCLNLIEYPVTLKCISANTKALNFYQSRGWHSIATGIGEDGEYQLMQTDKL